MFNASMFNSSKQNSKTSLPFENCAKNWVEYKRYTVHIGFRGDLGSAQEVTEKQEFNGIAGAIQGALDGFQGGRETVLF